VNETEVEELVGEHIAERMARVSVPEDFPSRVLGSLEPSRVERRRIGGRPQLLGAVAIIAMATTLAGGVAWLRIDQKPTAGTHGHNPAAGLSPSEQPNGPGVVQNRPGVAQAAPLADWYADWAGRPTTNGARTLSRSDHPTVILTVTNTTQSPVTWDFDLFILASDPGRISAGSVPTYNSFAGQVWDWRQANPGSQHRFSLSPRGSSSISIDWPLTNTAGEPVADGSYFAVLAVSHQGVSDGFAASALDIRS